MSHPDDHLHDIVSVDYHRDGADYVEHYKHEHDWKVIDEHEEYGILRECTKCLYRSFEGPIPPSYYRE